MSKTKQQGLSYALSVLGRRRQTKFQLTQKLERRGYDGAIIKSILEYCEERKYLDDQEFASLWIEDRIKLKPMGRWRLKQELGQKGIEASIIEVVLEEMLPLERELVLVEELLNEKLGRVQGQAEIPKIISFLIRRGFSLQQIYQVAEGLGLSFYKNNPT